MRQLLAGAVLLGAAAWFGRTKQERAWPELEQMQPLSDVVDQMGDKKYVSELCVRAAVFGLVTDPLVPYVEEEGGWGDFAFKSQSPCAWDIRKDIKQSREKLTELQGLTRHKRFRPSDFSRCSLGQHAQAMESLATVYGRKAVGGKDIDQNVAMYADASTRTLINAEKVLGKLCPSAWDRSQGFTWVYGPNEAEQMLYEENRFKKGKGMRFL
jgi:hypothetical protein